MKQSGNDVCGHFKRCVLASLLILPVTWVQLNNHDRCSVGSVWCYFSLFSDCRCWLCPTLGCNTSWSRCGIGRPSMKLRDNSAAAEHPSTAEHCKHSSTFSWWFRVFLLTPSHAAPDDCTRWANGRSVNQSCVFKSDQPSLTGCWPVTPTAWICIPSSLPHPIFIFPQLFCLMLWCLWIPAS